MIESSSGVWVHAAGPPFNPQAHTLEFGATRSLWLRKERVAWSGLTGVVSILYASDLHLGSRWSGRVVADLAAAVQIARPTIILLGGDLADTRRGLVYLETCIERLTSQAPVWAVAGNHDRSVGLKNVRRSVERGGGRWLQDGTEDWPVATVGTVRLHGCIDRSAGSRRSCILCAHDPAVFSAASEAGYGLVLAGHLHGSQCVLAERDGMLYPGAWFFRYNGLRFHRNGCRMLVSRGMADTLPVRWNCPREIVWCELV